jgi:hypothetical protein
MTRGDKYRSATRVVSYICEMAPDGDEAINLLQRLHTLAIEAPDCEAEARMHAL